MKCDFGNCECPDQDVHRLQNIETGHAWNYHLPCLRAFLAMMADIDPEFEASLKFVFG